MDTWTGGAAGSMPFAVSHKRTLLFKRNFGYLDGILRFTSDATLADLLSTSMAAEVPFTHFVFTIIFNLLCEWIFYWMICYVIEFAAL